MADLGKLPGSADCVLILVGFGLVVSAVWSARSEYPVKTPGG
jgi:hypothetical protein